jgi:H2-forming N5,N10-methylenetetrahydromethanopterin dehydrogenase-like enzyme
MILTLILWMNTANAEVKNNGCEKLLDKCAIVVEKQKKAINEQQDVIDSQEKLVKHLKEVSEEQEKEIKDTRSWLFGSNIFLLLLMLL